MTVKRRCLVCRLGSDSQKVEPLEVIAGTVLWGPGSGPGVRVPLCRAHQEMKPRLLEVLTGET